MHIVKEIIHKIIQGFEKMLFWLEEHYIGILTTIALHLFIISMILVLKIRTNAQRDYSIMLDMSLIQELPEDPTEETRQEESVQELVQTLNQEYNVRNIPVNVAENRAIENIDKMVRDIKNEMNITDPPDPYTPEEIAQQEQELLEEEARIYDEKYPENEMGERTVYQGPTTVSYDLSDRRHISMPIPAYKCLGHGKIVVDIVVNRKGYVLSAEINKSKSDSQDPCLTEAAKRDAERSRFNNSSSAPNKQQGSITYIFFAQ
ncbi:MAG: hypothetical protein LBQ60_02525 [Bacteroidales bacterium]|jgi:outer membrane biosynthesis protein TonB|nr:hypothetical protein [Bacteroidales bacterium]